MKKLLSTFLLFAFSFAVRADLNFEIDSNGQLHVWGCAGFDQYLDISNICNNALGSCTNCVQISPEEMHEYKTNILSLCDSALEDLLTLELGLEGIATNSLLLIDDISTFRRFGTNPVGGNGYAQLIPLTNYIYSVVNTQTSLDASHRPNSITRASVGEWVSYNNGIYDYANDYVLPQLNNEVYYPSIALLSDVRSARSNVTDIQTIVYGFNEEACQGCGGGGEGGEGGGGEGGGSCGDCPCAEQMEAIGDYVKHIDDDFHDQLLQMSVVTNFVERMDSYAKLVSGILYNDATIVVDDGENSWSNVYRRGYSDLYDYDKSNILQRIELLLFGVASNTGSSWTDSDISGVSTIVDYANEGISDLSDSVLQAKTDLESNITSIRDKLNQLWRNLNFFGAGALADFDLIQPFTVFEMYDVSVASKHVQDLDNVRNISRTACQIIYWTVAIIVLLLFYFKAVSLAFAWLGGFLKFFNGILS